MLPRTRVPAFVRRVSERHVFCGYTRGMSNGADFVAWATDPARTADQLFTVELLIERARLWQEWPFRDRTLPFDEEMAAAKARKLNPAYRPTPARDEIEVLPQFAHRLTHLMLGGSCDRPLRNLEALRFFPALDDLSFANLEVADFSPLAALPRIRGLTVQKTGFLNFADRFQLAQIGAQPTLDRLWLSLRHPWPDVQAMANFPKLRELHFNGNILALTEVTTLPAVEFADVSVWPDGRVPLRDLRSLPAMPKLKLLKLATTVSLEGIERYASVVNLELRGEFRDLTPLSVMSNVTALTLTGEFFTDLTPLARMPNLREIDIVSERPIDLSPLTETPALRRVEFSRCAIMRTELAALNAGLLPEALDFLADAPRPLRPLKFFEFVKDDKAGPEFFRQQSDGIRKQRDAFYGHDRAFETAEVRSFHATLQTKLDGLLGRGWGLVGKVHGVSSAGWMNLGFKRFADTSRIREILQLLRETSAASRFPWEYLINVEPHGDMTDELADLKELEEEEKAPEDYWAVKYHEPQSVLREDAEHLQMRRETYNYLEREHLLRLREQQGEPVDPELFEAPDEVEPTPVDAEFEEEPNESKFEENDTGGVAIAPPPPPPPDEASLSDQLQYYVTLYEDCMVVGSNWAARARYNLGEAPVPWSVEFMGPDGSSA